MSTHLPIACCLGSRELAARQEALRASVLAEAQSVERTADGYRWRFAGGDDLFTRLAPVIDAERRCCRFLRVSLVAEPDLGAVTLSLAGPEGTADFLESWITSAR